MLRVLWANGSSRLFLQAREILVKSSYLFRFFSGNLWETWNLVATGSISKLLVLPATPPKLPKLCNRVEARKLEHGFRMIRAGIPQHPVSHIMRGTVKSSATSRSEKTRSQSHV